MGKVDRDLKAILKFCKDFQTEYLNEQKIAAEKMKKVAEDISSALNGTKFATGSSSKIEEAAEQIIKAVQTGEERIREIERKTKQELDQLQEFNNCR